MVKSFDIDKYNPRECRVHNHGFYLGEQSKQAEVDELQKRIDEALKFTIDAHSDLNIGMLMMVDILKGEHV